MSHEAARTRAAACLTTSFNSWGYSVNFDGHPATCRDKFLIARNRSSAGQITRWRHWCTTTAYDVVEQRTRRSRQDVLRWQQERCIADDALSEVVLKHLGRIGPAGGARTLVRACPVPAPCSLARTVERERGCEAILDGRCLAAGTRAMAIATRLDFDDVLRLCRLDPGARKGTVAIEYPTEPAGHRVIAPCRHTIRPRPTEQQDLCRGGQESGVRAGQGRPERASRSDRSDVNVLHNPGGFPSTCKSLP